MGPDSSLAGGAAPDDRYVFDTSRLSVEMEVDYGHGLELEGEVEFEHGGTGAALELEHEEFGEYEQEIEKGGEVVLEELYLEKRFGPRLAVKAGRFYIALGLLSDYHRPTDYLGTARPESETTVVPAVWDEMGVEARVSGRRQRRQARRGCRRRSRSSPVRQGCSVATALWLRPFAGRLPSRARRRQSRPRPHDRTTKPG